jgi:membrane-associated protein
VDLALPVVKASLLPEWLDPERLLSGLTPTVIVILCVILFAESSVFPVLPGDSLLFTAGLFVAIGAIDAPLWLVCTLATVAAIIGNVVGFGIGWKVGPALFKPDSKFFKPAYVEKTHAFLDKHGAKAVVLARFVPFVRTFITWIAGVGRMDPRKYFTYTVLGGILWAAGLIVLGYVLGDNEFVRNNIDVMAILIVFVSVLPLLVEYLRARRKKQKSAAE